MVAEDFKELLPKVAKDKRPFCYLWVFDPQTDKVHIARSDSPHPADFPTHKRIIEKNGVHHPEHQKGWATAITNGWRIFTTQMKEPDPYIKRQVQDALSGKHPAPPLPNIRYHGDPHG